MPIFRNSGISMFAYLSNSLIFRSIVSRLFNTQFVQRKHQHSEHHHNKSRIVLWRVSLRESIRHASISQPCGALAMRSRALPVHSMITTKYNCTLLAFFFCSPVIVSLLKASVLHSAVVLSADKACPWLPRKLSSRNSSLAMASRCHPTCPASRVHEYPSSVQRLCQVVHPAGALGPVV